VGIENNTDWYGDCVAPISAIGDAESAELPG